ncbi:MAG: cache domain-containing protein, partial [Deltaproteobacteria bacterium]|nr:cache domain-containing protein [Deltaproteobacteria bacterium]
MRGNEAKPGRLAGVFSAVRPSLPQLLVVCGAFFALSLVSYFYVSDIMKHQVDLYSRAEMEVHRSRMRSLLYAHESALRHAAAFASFEAERGAGPESLQRLMHELTGVFSTQPEMEGVFVSVYGYINSNYLDGKSYIPGDLFYPSTAPWLRGALETDGIFHSRPYVDPVTGDAVAAVSTVVRKSDGVPIGVIAIDYLLTPLIDRVRGYRVSDSGWGFLVDDSFTLLTCPNPAYLDRKLSEYPGFASLGPELMAEAGPARSAPGYLPPDAAWPASAGAAGSVDAALAEAASRGGKGKDGGGGDLSGPAKTGEVLVKTVTLEGEENIVFFSTLENGWHIGIVAPFRYYYSEVFRMFPTITLLGAALSVVVCFILLRMSQAKKR